MFDRQSRRPFFAALPLAALAILAVADPRIACADPVTIRIGVSSTSQDTKQEDWKELAEWLARRVRDSLDLNPEDLKIELVAGKGMEDHLRNLCPLNPRDGKTLQGAILSPFRYVLAHMRDSKIDAIARVQRPMTLRLQGDPSDRSVVDKKRWADSWGTECRSILVIRADGAWPPSSESPKNFGYSSPHSASEFLLPVSQFRDKGWFTPTSLLDTPKVSSGAAAIHLLSCGPFHQGADKEYATFDTLPWTEPEDPPDSCDALNRLFSDPPALPAPPVPDPRTPPPPPRLDCAATSDYDLQILVPDTHKYRIVWTSESSIPFECVAIDTGAKQFEGKAGERRLEALRHAFLETKGLTGRERETMFQFRPNDIKGNESGPEGETLWVRHPNIHAFVDARDEDYDVVRNEAVLAMGGTVLHVALSRGAHRKQMTEDMTNYLGPLRDALFGAASARERVALDFIPYSPGQVDHIKTDLADGKLHAAELSAFHAAEVIGREEGVLLADGHFVHVTDSPASGPKEHAYYVLAALKPGSPEQPSRDSSFAITRKDSSSGYIYPAADLKSRRGIEVKEQSVVPCGDAWGVIQALENFADGKTEGLSASHAFLPDYEYFAVKKEEKPGIPPKFKSVDEGGREPNTVLVGSKHHCPKCDGPTINSASDDGEGREMHAFALLLKKIPLVPLLGGTKEVFLGYEVAAPKEGEFLRKFWRDTRPSYALWVGIAVALMVAGSFFAVMLARKRDATETGTADPGTPSPPPQPST